jgi:hypothetical protein
MALITRCRLVLRCGALCNQEYCSGCVSGQSPASLIHRTPSYLLLGQSPVPHFALLGAYLLYSPHSHRALPERSAFFSAPRRIPAVLVPCFLLLLPLPFLLWVLFPRVWIPDPHNPPTPAPFLSFRRITPSIAPDAPNFLLLIGILLYVLV